MTVLQKVSGLELGGETKFSQPAVFQVAALSNGDGRLVAGVPSGDPQVLSALVACLEAPFFVLYVLHTSRGEGKPGRYQSPEVSGEDLGKFISTYSELLQSDARFDLWVYSPSSKGTVVWDRHNLLYAYGPIESYEAALLRAGFTLGTADANFPHVHHYRAECDVAAQSLLGYFDWVYSPLQPQDEQ